LKGLILCRETFH
jgi:DNA (cytosine-5)-methyltransferase 1